MSLPSCSDVKKMCQKLLVKGKDTGVLWSQGERQWSLCNSTWPSAVNPLQMVSKARPLELLHNEDQSSRLQKTLSQSIPREHFWETRICSINGRSRLPICLRKEEKVKEQHLPYPYSLRDTLSLTAGIRWCANLYVLAIFFSCYCPTRACTDVNNYIPETNAAPGGRVRGGMALTEQGKK